jgi:hypothetical protein
VNPALVVIGAIVAVLAIGFAAWSWRERARILAAPVVDPANAGAHTGEVIVAGVARGTVTTSPWTGRDGLVFSADELVDEQERSQDGSTRRRTSKRSLGTHLEHVEIADAGSTTAVPVRQTDKITMRHFPKLTTASRGGQLPSISIGSFSLASDRSRVEEVVVSDGDRVWVYGTVETNADGASHLAGKQIWSAKAPDAMASQLQLNALAGAGAALIGVILLVVGLTA